MAAEPNFSTICKLCCRCVFHLPGGLVGQVLHLRGTRYLVGGVTLRNLMAGPPPMLPLAYFGASTGAAAALPINGCAVVPPPST